MGSLGKKSKIARTTLYRLEYKVETRGLRDRWSNECEIIYKMRRNKKTKRHLYSSQIRMYRTWKHNRKTQWKE